jgi:amino acid transporter
MVRTLGLTQLTMIGIGAIIGAGIFSLAAAVARDVAGHRDLLLHDGRPPVVRPQP